MELGNNFVLKLEARERNICSVFSNAPPAVVDASSDFVESYNVSLNIIALILSGIGDCAIVRKSGRIHLVTRPLPFSVEISFKSVNEAVGWRAEV